MAKSGPAKSITTMISAMVVITGISMGVIIFDQYQRSLVGTGPDLFNHFTWIVPVLSLIALGCIASIGLHFFNHVLHLSNHRQVENAPFWIALLVLVTTCSAVSPWTDPAVNGRLAWILYTSANAGLCWLVLGLCLNHLRIGGRWPLYIRSAMLAAFFLAGLAHMTQDSWITSRGNLFFMGLLRTGCIGLLPLTVFILTWQVPALRLDHRSLKQSFLLRMSMEGDNSLGTRQFFGIVSLNFLLFSGSMLHFFLLPEPTNIRELAPVFPLYAFSLSWIPAIFSALPESIRNFRDLRSKGMYSNLTPVNARRFLSRTRQDKRGWAATVGMRTAIFMVDHDPFDESPGRLTQTLAHIRREEINRYIRSVLNERLLQIRLVGNQMHGVIDPEYSNRSCVDTLAMFACIYLDVVPLVERRLKGLASLFPIIDPNLSGTITADSIEESHARMEWLFSLHFDWVDQQVISNYDASLSYGVTAGQVRASDRSRIMNFLKSRKRMGSFIWISDRARERLLLEAPHLASTIEAKPIDEKDGSSWMIFLIRFESLIPRLQKYYNLEPSRSVLKDYEASRDSLRYINMLELQISAAKSLGDLEEPLSSLTTYKWRGFKEKDKALKTVMLAFTRYQEMISLEKDDLQSERIYDKFLIIIRMIGYPSQILHTAHMNKRGIRNTGSLRAICLDPTHKRFYEAWIYLATTDPTIYPEQKRMELLEIIRECLSHAEVASRDIVVRKAVEAFYNIGSHISPAAWNGTLEDLFNNIANHLVRNGAGHEQLSLFFDARRAIHKDPDNPAQLNPDTLKNLERHMEFLAQRYGEKSSQYISLLGRWKIMLQGLDIDRAS